MTTYFLAIEKYIEILPNLKTKHHSYVNLPIANLYVRNRAFCIGIQIFC